MLYFYYAEAYDEFGDFVQGWNGSFMRKRIVTSEELNGVMNRLEQEYCEKFQPPVGTRVIIKALNRL